MFVQPDMYMHTLHNSLLKFFVIALKIECKLDYHIFLSTLSYRYVIIKVASCLHMLPRKETDMTEFTKLSSIGHRRIRMVLLFGSTYCVEMTL